MKTAPDGPTTATRGGAAGGLGVGLAEGLGVGGLGVGLGSGLGAGGVGVGLAEGLGESLCAAVRA